MISAQGHGQSLVHGAFVCSHRDTDPAKLLPWHSEVKQGLAPVQVWCHDCTAQSFSVVWWKKKTPPHSRIEGMTEMWLGTYRCFFFCHYFCWNDSLLLCSWRNITHYRGQLWFCFIFKYILHHPPTHSAAFLKERHTPTWEDRTPTISRASCSSTRGLTALWIVMAASPELRNWCRVHFLEKLVGSRWRLAVWYWFLLHAKVKEIQCQWCYCKFYESGDLEKPITTYWLYFFNICARQSLWVTTGEGLLHIWAHHSLSMLMWRQSKLSSSHSATL